MRHTSDFDGSPDRAFKDRIKSRRMSGLPTDSISTSGLIS